MGYYVQVGFATAPSGSGFGCYCVMYAAGNGGETETFVFDPPLVVPIGEYVVAASNFPTTAVFGACVARRSAYRPRRS